MLSPPLDLNPKWFAPHVAYTIAKYNMSLCVLGMAAELKALDLFKLLPGTNCKKCGEPSCLAFAVKLVGRDTEITKCDPLFSEKYQGKQKFLT